MDQVCNIHQSDLISLCVDKRCRNRGLICQVCARENHMTHIIIPFQEFCDFIQNDVKASQTQSELEREIKNQEEEFSQLTVQLDKIIKSAQEYKENLSNQLAKQINLQKKYFDKKLEQFQGQVRAILNKQEGYQEIVQKIFSQEDDYILNENNYIMQIQFSEINKIKEKLNNFQEQFRKYHTNVNEYFGHLESDLNKLDTFTCPQIQDLDESILYYENCLNQQIGISLNQRIYRYRSVAELEKSNLKNFSAISLSERTNIQKDELLNAGFIQKNSTQKVITEDLQSLTQSPQLSAQKLKCQPKNKKEFYYEMQQITKNQGIKGLWVDLPNDLGIGEIRYLTQVIKLNQNIKKLFINFPKTIYVNNQAFEDLFESLKVFSSMEVLSLKLKKQKSNDNSFIQKNFSKNQKMPNRSSILLGKTCQLNLLPFQEKLIKSVTFSK